MQQFKINEINRKCFFIVELHERETISKTISNQFLKYEKILKSVLETLQEL